jgi:hypothetical protein
MLGKRERREFVLQCMVAVFVTVLAISCKWALAVGGEVAFDLRDHLGVAWHDELVTFSFEFPEGECHPESLRLQGVGGPIPVQIVNSRAWPDGTGFLQSATIGFFADLSPLAINRYRLSWQADPDVVGAQPPSGLKVGRSGDLVAVSSHAFGAVFRAGGEEFTAPVVAARVPGPVQEMLLPDGRRFGGSELYGPSKIVAWSGEVVAEGPVFADIRWRYRYADGTEFLLRGRMGARDTAVYWDMSCRGNLPNDGWRLLVSNGLPPLSLLVHIEHFSSRKIKDRPLDIGEIVPFPVANEPVGRLTSLTPWADWVNDYTQTVVILDSLDGSPAFFAASRDPGAWIEPQANVTQGSGGRLRKSLPLMKREDSLVTLDAAVIDQPGGGLRRWMTGVLTAATHKAVVDSIGKGPTAPAQRMLQLTVDKRRLDSVKGFVLSWPETAPIGRPMLIANQDDIKRCRSSRGTPRELMQSIERVRSAAISHMPNGDDGIALAAWLVSGSQRIANEVRLAERLRQRLDLLGNFDLMRSTQVVALLYDGVIDSGLVSEAEGRVLRARMAYLGYLMEDPGTWSTERGYNTSLPNMDVSMTLGKGFVACALPDHPIAEAWIAPALGKMDHWLNDEVGSRGEWMEGPHYDHVTASMMLSFAIAAKNAGFRDYSRHEKFQQLLEHMAKQYTPPDPTRGGLRVTPPLGRANAGVRLGIFGVMARFTRDTAPEYSAEMQWAWQQSGRRYDVFDNRLGGLEYLYIDPNLPARQPAWGSEWFPLTTAVLRNRFGLPGEDYVCLMLNPDIHFARGSEIGAILQWYAFGVPVAGAFTGGYAERHELLTSRVVPASGPASAEAWRRTAFHRVNGGVTFFFTQPGLDYLDARYTIGEPASTNWPQPTGMPAWPPVARSGTTPIAWRRQVAFVKGGGANEAAYLVFRDTVETDQPTLWQFWTWSNGIREVGPGAAPPAVESPSAARALVGRRYTAAGQHGVDLDFFVVAPRDPLAFTLRWGTQYTKPPDRGRREDRDLLQLRREGVGCYTVVVVPRHRGAPPATVAAAQEGRVLRIRHSYGEDLVVFGNDAGITTAVGDVHAVPISCVQTRGKSATVTLGPAGKATIGGRSFETQKPIEFPIQWKE